MNRTLNSLKNNKILKKNYIGVYEYFLFLTNVLGKNIQTLKWQFYEKNYKNKLFQTFTYVQHFSEKFFNF